EAVRDAVETTLGSAPPDPDSPGPPRRLYQDHRDSSYHEPHRELYRDRYADERSDRDGDDHADDDPWSAASHEPALPSCVAPNYPPAWWSLLPPALQLLGWWRRRSRRPVETALEIVAATVVAYLAIGPIASVVVATAGTALTLSGLIGALRDLAGGLGSHRLLTAFSPLPPLRPPPLLPEPRPVTRQMRQGRRRSRPFPTSPAPSISLNRLFCCAAGRLAAQLRLSSTIPGESS